MFERGGGDKLKIGGGEKSQRGHNKWEGVVVFPHGSDIVTGVKSRVGIKQGSREAWTFKGSEVIKKWILEDRQKSLQSAVMVPSYE